jgi:hypothetical protein
MWLVMRRPSAATMAPRRKRMTARKRATSVPWSHSGTCMGDESTKIRRSIEPSTRKRRRSGASFNLIA